MGQSGHHRGVRDALFVQHTKRFATGDVMKFKTELQ